MAMELLKGLEIMARDQHHFKSTPTCSDCESGNPLFASLWEAKNVFLNFELRYTCGTSGSPLREELQMGHGLGLLYVTESMFFGLDSDSTWGVFQIKWNNRNYSI